MVKGFFEHKKAHILNARKSANPTRLNIPFSFSAGGSVKEVEEKFLDMIRQTEYYVSDYSYVTTPKEDLKIGNSGWIIVRSSAEKIDALRKVVWKNK